VTDRASLETRAIGFWIVAVIAALVIWIPSYPPPVDLAQHAGQVRFLHDWFASDFTWGEPMELNWFTPYLVGYALGALFTTVMPAVAATKLVWSLATIGTVYTSVRLRRLVGGDPRWDWLILPGLFGMTFTWGFFSFFASVPIGLFALERWIRYLRAPDRRGALVVSGLFALLFFAHILTTAWVMTVAGIMLLATWRGGPRGLPRVLLHGLPLLAPLVIGIAWWEYLKLWGGPGGRTVWRVGTERFVDFFPQWLGIDAAFTIGVGLLLLAIPFVAGARFARDAIRLAPLAITLVIVMVVPYHLQGNAFTYNRFYTFLGPALVLAIAAPRAAGRFHFLRAMLPVLAVAWTLLFVVRMAMFRAESDDFVQIVDRMEPNRHVVSMVLQPGSEAAGLELSYLHFPVWYQVATGGFVEFSFSSLAPTIVRFKNPYHSPIKRGFEFEPHPFDMTSFDYILVRGGSKDRPLSSPAIRLVAHEGTWWLYAPVR
jgi:hypothetical protein